MELTPGATALVVVDMQNGFLAPNGSCTRAGLDCAPLREAVAGCRSLIAAAREHAVPVIHTRYVYRPDYADGGLVVKHFFPTFESLAALRADTDDVEVFEALAPLPGEPVVDKNRPSAFYGTPLESYLRGFDADSLIVCGVTANVCVESTVRDAMHRDFKVWVPREATADFEPARYEAALAGMAWMFARIVSLSETLDRMPELGAKLAEVGAGEASGGVSR